MGTQLPLKRDTAPTFRPMSIVTKRLDGSRCHLVRMYIGLGPGHIVLDGDLAPPPKGHCPIPILGLFGLYLLWVNVRPSQLLLSTCFTLSIKYKVSSAFQVSRHFELNMFNSCATGRNCCHITAKVTVAVATDRRNDRVRGLAKPQVASVIRLFSRTLSCLYTRHVGLGL